MIRKSLSIPFLGLVCFVIYATTAAADEVAAQKAVNAAKAWLALVDSGEYEKSWET